MSVTPPVNPEVSPEEGWEKARLVAGLLGPFPSMISKAIKVLWDEQQQHGAEPSDAAKRVLTAVAKSQKLIAPLRAAAAQLTSREYAKKETPDPSESLLLALGPGLASVCLFFIFVHRRGSKLSTCPDWSKLSNDLIANMELGHALGLASPRLGPASGMLVGGLRHAAMIAFMVENPGAYAKYRLKGSKKFDLEYERSTWVCDHCQVAAFLLLDAGFGKDQMEVAAALRKTGKAGAMPEDIALWRSAAVFIDHLKSGICPPPDSSHVNRLGIPASATHEGLKAKYSQLYGHGPTFEWMLRTSKDQ